MSDADSASREPFAAEGLAEFVDCMNRGLVAPVVRDFPLYGPMRLLPLPAGLPSLWVGSASFGGAAEARVLFEVDGQNEPSSQQQMQYLVLRRMTSSFLASARELLSDALESLAASDPCLERPDDWLQRFQVLELRIARRIEDGATSVMRLSYGPSPRWWFALRVVLLQPVSVEIEDPFMPGVAAPHLLQSG